jgi:D-alanine-D-alanine ligase
MRAVNKKRPRVALLFGGRSAEHEVSVKSAAAIFANLDSRKYRILCIYINKKGMWRAVESPLLPLGRLGRGRFASFLPWRPGPALGDEFQADIYFPVLHGPCGEDGTIQGLLEMADVPYVGAGVTASALGMDKSVHKALFAAAGLPVVKHLVFQETEWRRSRAKVLGRIRARIPVPLFVKPSNLGSSVGITKVKSASRLGSALDRSFAYDDTVLVEEAIEGRELECSILGHRTAKASLPGELIPDREYYDYADKYLRGKTRFRIPAPIPAETAEEVRRLAAAAFKLIGCSGMARVDFFLEARTGKVYLNEINTIPGFTEISMYPRLWAVSGIGFPALLDELIRLGFERHRGKKRCLELQPA